MSNKTKIVWIYGSSGSGKETFIRHTIKYKPLELLQRLGWNRMKLTFVPESIEYIAQYQNDPVGDKREKIINTVVSLVGDIPQVILIKGQDLDLKHLRLQRLKEKLPDCDHSIIFLHADITELYRRWHSKSWWDPKFSQETVKKWLLSQISKLEKLSLEFEIRALLSDSTKSYKNTDFPPFLY